MMLDLVKRGHWLLVLSETSMAYATGFVVLFAGKSKVKLKV